MSQVLDRPNSAGHFAANWSQAWWDTNRQNVDKRIPELLGRELASPIRRSVNTLESLGLVEVTYPGLEQLEPPAQFLGALPTESLRQAVRRSWTDLLASLCDTLRTDGVITLGDDLDDTYNFGRMLIGRWASAEDERGARLVRFIGATERQRRRSFAVAVLKSYGMSDPQAEATSGDLLRVCFQQLLEVARNESLPWLKTGQRQATGEQVSRRNQLGFLRAGPTEAVNPVPVPNNRARVA